MTIRKFPVTATVYKTSDGAMFESEPEADKHQGILDGADAFDNALELVDYYPREAPGQRELAEALAKHFIIMPRKP